MKKFILDQVLFLIVGFLLAVIIPHICGPIFTLVLETVVILCWGYLCRRVLLLPLDFVVGTTTKIVSFSSQFGKEEYEFFKGNFFSNWMFCYENGQKLILSVPGADATNFDCIMLPLCDKRIKVTYYKFSHILLSWKYI